MIRALSALTRQTQDFFHSQLLDLYRWDDVKFIPPEKNERPLPTENSRGRRRRAERPEGKYHAILRIEFGIWKLTIESPNEHPPLGWLTLDGYGIVEGILDASTWKQIADHIKQNHKEISNGSAQLWS